MSCTVTLKGALPDNQLLMMLNPFKYKPVPQRDDEDEDVLYQGKNIPLSNLGETNFDDEVELELPRKPPTERRRTLLALCTVIIIFIIFVSLLITLIFYTAMPHLNGQESNSTVTQSTVQYIATSIVTPSAIINSSSTEVVMLKTSSRFLLSSSSRSSSSSILPASTSTGHETTSGTATEMSSDELQSTASATSVTAVTTVLLTKQTSKSTSSTPKLISTAFVSTAALSTLATPVVSSEIKLLSPDSYIITSTMTEGMSPNNNNNNTQMLNSMISTLIEPTATANSEVSSSGTVYPSVVSYNHESTISIPAITNLPTVQNDTIHWHKMNFNASSETTPFVIDVNSDGIDDIIYTYSYFVKHLYLYYCTSSTDYENACMEETGYPVCGSNLVAVNGLNGELIWSHDVTRPVFGIRCVMDVNDDGETDCFVIGRYHQWETIDKKTGETIWEADASIGYPGYNFYYPLPLEDFDGDGIVDILNIHGGDQTYGSDETNRSPALIVILSGKTGKKLIDPIVVPDGLESYMSPVRYTFADKNVVLFGTGGETITGSLWAITIDSIKEYVRSRPLTSTHNTESIGCHSDFLINSDKFRPIYDGTIYQLYNQERQPFADCPSFGQHLPISNKYKLCLYELYHCSSKGMIIPPVIIDMNNDNVQDLLIQSFDGHVVGLDGSNGRELWNRYIPGSESYNVPAPLFYNDDDTPDFFLRVNIGEWDEYDYSYVVIIDGVDGKALWAMNSSFRTMQSAVTLMSINHSQDAVMFFAYSPIETKDINGATKVKRRQMDTDEQSTSVHDGAELPPNMDIPPDAGLPNEEGDVGNIKHLGEQFWNLSDASFPDPLVDPKGFYESCNYQLTGQQSYLYLITRDRNTGDEEIDPVAAAFPVILIPGHGIISIQNTEKRHEDFEPSPEMLERVRNDAWRCSYVQFPSAYSPITPVIADLNHDGKLEVIYSFQFTSENIFFGASVGHALFDLHVQTIENMVQSDMIDFSKFLPIEKQSWTTYMGSKGDGMYSFHESLFKSK